MFQAEAARQEEKKGESVEDHDRQEKDVQLIDRDGAIDSEDTHPGGGLNHMKSTAQRNCAACQRGKTWRKTAKKKAAATTLPPR